MGNKVKMFYMCIILPCLATLKVDFHNIYQQNNIFFLVGINGS